MELPLLIRAQEDDEQFRLTPVDSRPTETDASARLTPGRLPAAGEQYRFHLDMTQCIGCKCCVVACNEQNGNPAQIQWRRVGEVEGGVFPHTIRHYVSMGCNHCLEPTCMTGCPVNAYTKDPLTGIVLHSAERCIGCQYCTWNCSYGVPQYNPERGVVGKCDMCYGRLTDGREPACVAACPEEAIRIEIVNIAEWRHEYVSQANAPGLPSADDSISTTRVTLRGSLPEDTSRVDHWRVEPQHPHWTLIFMTVLTQLAAGAITSMAILKAAAHLTLGRGPVTGVVLTAMLSLAASTLHLGRPAYAWRALSMWRRSWLSREALAFSLFSVAAGVYAGLLWAGSAAAAPVGIAAAALGLAGVYASARLYMVAARPAWNSRHTILEFGLSGAFTGALTVALFLPAARPALMLAAASSAMALAIQQLAKAASMRMSGDFERRAAGELLLRRFRTVFLLRHLGLWGVAMAMPAMGDSIGFLTLCLAAAIGLELTGRWLFFVSVVPRNMAAPYLSERRAA
ncbi:MAG TPA: DmsC/YnfH family molybdoenzyme membrane anchor subunit [Acidobacteriaceae bacterium]